MLAPDGQTAWLLWTESITPADTGISPPNLVTGPAVTGLGTDLDDVAITPDGGTVLVTSPTDNRLTPVSTATRTAGTPVTLDAPTGVAVAPDGATAYVFTGASTLTPVSLPALVAGTPIALAHPGRRIGTTPDGALAIVGRDGRRPELPAGGEPGLRHGRGADHTRRRVGQRTRRRRPTAPPPTSPKAAIVRPFDVAARTVGAALTLPTASDVTSLAVSADRSTLFGAVPCRIRPAGRASRSGATEPAAPPGP